MQSRRQPLCRCARRQLRALEHTAARLRGPCLVRRNGLKIVLGPLQTDLPDVERRLQDTGIEFRTCSDLLSNGGGPTSIPRILLMLYSLRVAVFIPTGLFAGPHINLAATYCIKCARAHLMRAIRTSGLMSGDG